MRPVLVQISGITEASIGAVPPGNNIAQCFGFSHLAGVRSPFYLGQWFWRVAWRGFQNDQDTKQFVHISA